MGTAVGTIRTTSHTLPYTLLLAGIYCYYGCMSGSWWPATAKSGPGTLFQEAVPGTTTGCHHAAPFSEGFYARPASIFDQKNYGARTDTVSGVADTLFGYYVFSLLRLKMRLWRDHPNGL